MAIRVFLVDDHALVRTGLKMILAGQPDMEVVGEAESGDQALPLVRKLQPDVVLCDFHLPGLSGLEVTERLVRGGQSSRVIIVSVMEDGPLPRRVLDAGAHGYIGKACDAGELVRAVRQVAAGQHYLGGNVARNIAMQSLNAGGSPFDALSPRELEVALLMVQGLAQGEIARRISLSVKTISTHKTNLFAKLDVRDMVSLVKLARQYGLVDPSSGI